MPNRNHRNCDCDGCRRIAALDEAASQAGDAAGAWDDWGLDDWMLDENDQPEPAQPINQLAIDADIAARSVRDFGRAAEVITQAAARLNQPARPNVLEIVEAAETCDLCGAVSEPFAVEDRLVCEPCYHNEIRRLYSCHTCGNGLEPGDRYEFEGHSHCRTCIMRLQDYCGHCGNVQPQGTMRRDSRQRPVCRGCYRPEWKPGVWKPARNTYHKIPRGFTYGIELETSHSENYADLEGKTSWGCVPEASTSGREFVSPVLKGDAGLIELENFVNTWGEEWEVDNYCGTHIHIGLHKFSLDQKRRIAYAYHCAWPFLAEVIGPQRAGNSMCGAPQWTLADLMMAGDIEDFAEARDRFEFVNWRSLLKYGTIEIRCLKGTLDVALISAWIQWHCKFIKKVASMSLGKLQKAMSTDAMFFCKQIDPAIVDELTNRMGVRGRNPMDLAAAVPARFRANRLSSRRG